MDAHRASRMANIASKEIEGDSSDGVGNGFERLIHASLPETSEAGMAISVNHLMGVGDG